MAGYYMTKKKMLEGIIKLAQSQLELKQAAASKLATDIVSLERIIETRKKELERLEETAKRNRQRFKA